MGQRKCAKDGCNRLEFRVSGFCLKHKDRIVSRSKPESILIESSEITNPQSKKPGPPSNPTVEKKERPSDKRSRNNDSKGKKTDIVVNDSDENKRALILVTGFISLVIGLLGMSLGDFCFSSIIFVIGLYLFLQSFSPTVEKRLGLLAFLSSVLIIISFVCVIGFFILLVSQLTT